MYNAFLLQSIGETKIAYYCFKGSFQYAKEIGENLNKLNSIYELFVWYRKYGFSCGVMLKPSFCINEYDMPNIVDIDE